MSLERLQAEVAELRRQVQIVQRQQLSIQNRSSPLGELFLGRIVSESEKSSSPASTDPSRSYDVVQHEVPPSPDPLDSRATRDTNYILRGVKAADHDGRVQSFAQEVVVVRLGQFHFVWPNPGRVVFVSVEATGAPFGHLAAWMDVDASDGGGGAIPTFSGPLPLLNIQDRDSFHASTYPYKIAGITTKLPAIHVFPLPDADGASSIPGVDIKLGFFITWVLPPGPVADTLIRETPLPAPPFGKKLVMETDIDGQGNVLDIRLSVEDV